MSDPSGGGSSGSASSTGGGGLSLQGLGGLTSAFGSLMGGSSQKAMYDYQAGVANLNAQIMYQNSDYAIAAGEHQAMQAGLQGAATMGQIKAAQGASGLDVNTGSAKDVQSSAAEITNMNMTTIRSNAAKTAYNYRTQGIMFGAQAQLDTMAGTNAQTAGEIGAMSSIIGTAASVSSSWMKGGAAGMWGAPGSNSGTNQLFGN